MTNMEADLLQKTVQKKLLKTIVYRLTASGLAQALSWFMFGRFEVNAAVLVADLIQMMYYFFFESVWGLNKSQVKSIKTSIGLSPDGIIITRRQLKHMGYTENTIREIGKWYEFT